MSIKYPNWLDYWKDVSVRLNDFIEEQRIPEAEDYIVCVLGLYSYITEDLEGKVTKNKDLIKHTFPMMVELQDILRGVYFSQKNLLLATSAFQLRTAFEIRCNLKFIFQHSDPGKIAERLANFFRYEQIVGSRLSPTLSYEGEVIEKAFAVAHPYWANKSSGLLKNNADWNGEDKGFKEICDDLHLEAEYFQYFKLTSKFIHGSPIVRNLYQRGPSIGSIPHRKHPTSFSTLAAHNIGECLMEYCEFFGVPFPEVQYRTIQTVMLKVQSMLEKM